MQPQEALSILEWYAAAGVMDACESAPVNRFESMTQRNSQAAVRSSVPRTQTPPVERRPAPVIPHHVSAALTTSPSAAVARASELADAATTLQALREAVEAFDGCHLKKTAARTVFADGNNEADVMLIGEAPGAEEDRQGIPFCGASGKLLDTMFESIHLPRSAFYITNMVFWRPPGNRTPTPEEIAICMPFVEKHIALINPKALVLIGATPAKALLQTETAITRLRGKTYSYQTPYAEASFQTFVTFHPSFLLRQSAQKRLAWHDLMAIESFIHQKN